MTDIGDTHKVNLGRVYDAINEVKLDVAIIKERSQVTADHESRIRTLERRSWSFAGIATLAGAALAQLVQFISSK